MAKAPVAKITASPRPLLSGGMEAQYEKCKKLAASVDKADAGSRNALRTALVELYSFGEALRKTPADLEAFIVGEGKKWNKPTRNNPYTALTQIIFPKRAKSRLSTYARALGTAHDFGHNEDRLKADLGPNGPGLEKLANVAVQAENERRTRSLRAALPATKERLATWPDLRDDPEFRTISGFAEVLVHVDAAGAFKIIDILATGQAMDGRLLRYAKPDRGACNTLRQALQFSALIPTKKGSPRITSLHVDGSALEIRAQGDDGMLVVGHLPVIDGLPEKQWMHFASNANDPAAFFSNLEDAALLSFTNSKDADGLDIVELSLTGSRGATRISTQPHEQISSNLRTLKDDSQLEVAFALNMRPSTRRALLNLGRNLLTAGAQVKLSDGRRLAEKRNARIEIAADADNLRFELSTVGGKAASYALPCKAIKGVPSEPLTLPAAPFFKALKQFDEFAEASSVFIRGNGRFVEFAVQIDGSDISLAIPNPLELQRNTTPFSALFGASDTSVRLEAAE